MIQQRSTSTGTPSSETSTSIISSTNTWSATKAAGKRLAHGRVHSLFTVFSDSMQFSNYHSTETIVQRPGGDLVIKGMIINAISAVLVAVSEGVESVRT